MRPVVGLALGSGGARGFAHIGVLKYFKEKQIPVDMVAGSSMGSLVGALYAVHQNPYLLEKVAVAMRRKYWTDFTVPRLGLLAGDKVRELVRLLTHGKNIEELSLPLGIVATDIQSGEEVTFTSGPVDLAVRASISIPGIFEPVFYGDRVLVDGGVVNRVPVSLLYQMGADIVIAVDVSQQIPRVKIRSLYDVVAQTMDVMAEMIHRSRQVTADVLICPEVGHISSTDFSQPKSCIEAGEEAAAEKLEEVLSCIREWQRERGTTS